VKRRMFSVLHGRGLGAGGFGGRRLAPRWPPGRPAFDRLSTGGKTGGLWGASTKYAAAHS